MKTLPLPTLQTHSPIKVIHEDIDAAKLITLSSAMSTSFQSLLHCPSFGLPIPGQIDQFLDLIADHLNLCGVARNATLLIRLAMRSGMLLPRAEMKMSGPSMPLGL